jgi:hypothetical protein
MTLISPDEWRVMSAVEKLMGRTFWRRATVPARGRVEKLNACPKASRRKQADLNKKRKGRPSRRPLSYVGRII